jgi:hypothetical protein
MEPRSLGDWVRLWFGPATDVSGSPAEQVGRLLRQNELVTDRWVDGDVEVLVCENLGTWLWGRTTDGRHVERENVRGTAWVPTGEDEEQFWLHHAAFEAMMAMPAARCGAGLTPLNLQRLEGFSDPLPCGTWRWPGAQRVRTHQATVVTVQADDAGGVEVMAGGGSERELGWIDQLGIEWNVYSSLRDDPA